MGGDFNGFSPAFFRFFEDLAAHNERAWFQANKARYRCDVVEPLSDFITAMAPRLKRLSPHYIADPRPVGGSMFRIYRDMRFARGGKPYKEHGACHFRHAAHNDVHAPGFYVHLAPGEVFFGGGVWRPSGDDLRAIRARIDERPADWAAVIDDAGLRACFGGVSGDGLIRPPRGFAANHRFIEDLKRKSFFAMKEGAPQQACAPRFIDAVDAAFQAAATLMRFLNQALGTPF